MRAIAPGWPRVARAIAMRPVSARPVTKRPIVPLSIAPVVIRRPLLVVAPPELLALEPRAFLITGHLVLRPRVFMVAAGPPAGLAVPRPRSALIQRSACFLLRRPRPPAFKPVQRHIRLRLLELRQCGQQVLAMFRTEGRGHGAVHDDPERVRSRHGSVPLQSLELFD